MSRIGNKPVLIPEKVWVSLEVNSPKPICVCVEIFLILLPILTIGKIEIGKTINAINASFQS